jgi:hypothetical protein
MCNLLYQYINQQLRYNDERYSNLVYDQKTLYTNEERCSCFAIPGSLRSDFIHTTIHLYAYLEE